MSNLVFPMPLAGYVKSREVFTDVLVDTAASGKEYRQTWQTVPRYRYTIAIDVLNSAATSRLDFQKVVGFFSRHYGQLDSFLLTDPEDSSVTTHAFGVGDGVTTDFQLQRTLVADADLAAPASRNYWPKYLDGYEPIFELNGSPSIFKAAVLQTITTNYTLPGLGVVHFTSAPAAAAVLTCTGNYYRRVRVTQGGMSAEYVALSMWSSGLQLISVKP